MGVRGRVKGGVRVRDKGDDEWQGEGEGWGCGIYHML